MAQRTPSSKVHREIGQRRPFSSREQEGVVALLRTADVVSGRLARAVEPSGVTLQQYNVLRILRGAGAEGLPTLDIRERMIERSPGITRLIDRLGAKGLVERHAAPEDRRKVLCRVTPAGLTLLADLDLSVEEADRAAMGMLDRGKLGRLIELLDAVRAGLDPG